SQYRQALNKLTEVLNTLSGMPEKTLAELFAEHPKPFSKATMLFTQRRSPKELFNKPDPNLGEYDYLLAAVLLGAHVRWRHLATEWKSTESLQNAVSARMA